MADFAYTKNFSSNETQGTQKLFSQLYLCSTLSVTRRIKE